MIERNLIKADRRDRRVQDLSLIHIFTSETMVGIIGCNGDGGTCVTGGDIASCASMLGMVSSADSFDVGFDIDRSGDLAIGSSFIGTTAMAYEYAETIIQNQ